MVDRHEDELADMRVIALYPGRLATLANRTGVRFRNRKKANCTVVPCRIEALDGRSVAVPEHETPAGTPAPMYRLQLETRRFAIEARQSVIAVMSAERGDWTGDPEQTLLSPIFDDGHRMIFEFRRAHVLRIDRRGGLETRFIAIDPVRGIVGTKTVHKFDTRLLGLVSRCVEHLHGAIDLFPMRDRALCHRDPIPAGEANLRFERLKSKKNVAAPLIATDPTSSDGPR